MFSYFALYNQLLSFRAASVCLINSVVRSRICSTVAFHAKWEKVWDCEFILSALYICLYIYTSTAWNANSWLC